jgi:hypothetical protein
MDTPSTVEPWDARDGSRARGDASSHDAADAEASRAPGAALPRPRPRFELRTTSTRPALLHRIRMGLRADKTLRGMVLPYGRVEITVAPNEQRAWSPQLVADVEEDGEGCVVHARFGPHPHVWTLYVILYGVASMVALACLIYGAAQLTIGVTPWALWLTPIAAVLAGLVFGAAYVGQGLGSEQMYRLRAFLERQLDAPEGEPTAEG